MQANNMNSNFFTFLLCSERAGSNLITKILDSHSEFCGPSPIHIMRYVLPLLRSYGDLNVKDNWTRIINDVIEIYRLKISFWNTSLSFDELYELKERSFRSIYRYIYEKEAAHSGKKRVFVKENQTYNLLPYILMAYPGTKFIYMVRDPRDMALSWNEAKALRGGIMRATQVWRQDQKQSIHLFKTLCVFDNILLLRYEDLLRDPERELKRVCNFLDCGYEESMLGFSSDKTTLTNSTEAFEWRNLAKGLLSGNFNKYKTRLNDEQIKYIEYYCREEMEFLGYDTDFPTESPEEIKSIEKALSKSERSEKPEYYLVVDEQERNKRQQLSEFLSNLNRTKLSFSDFSEAAK